MKLLASAVLLGAAAAALPPHQHVLQNHPKHTKPDADTWSKPLHTLSEALKHMTAEARAVWDEVSMMFPEAMDAVSFFSAPKPHVRKPDSAWDYVIKGADVQR
jgi:cathepsin A (carboxypeptidase C)